MMKKYLAIALSILSLLGLIGCGQNNSSNTGETKMLPHSDTSVSIDNTGDTSDTEDTGDISDKSDKGDTGDILVEDTGDILVEDTGDTGELEIEIVDEPSGDQDINVVESDFGNPNTIGDWNKTTRYNPASNSYDEIYYKINNVVFGDEAQSYVDEYNKESSSPFILSEIPNIEFFLISYAVYVPEDWNDGGNGLYSANIDFDVIPNDANNNRFEVNGDSYISLGDAYSLDINHESVYPGNIWSGHSVGELPKDVDNFLITNEAYDSEYNVLNTNYTIYYKS